MKLTQVQIDSLVRRVLGELERKKLVTFNKTKEAIFSKGSEIINDDYQKESELDNEIKAMIDHMEQEQGDNFDRHKMFLMMKRKIADERGIPI